MRRAFLWAAWLGLMGCGGSTPKPTPRRTPPPPPEKPAVTKTDTTIGETAIPNQAVERAPVIDQSASAILDAGRDAAAAGDLSGARARFEEAAALDSQFAEAHYNLGIIDEWQGKYGEARHAYEAALRARSEFGPAVVAIAQLMVRQGNREGALRFAQQQLAKSPDSNGLHNALNRVRLIFHRADAVIRDSKKVLRRDEKNVAAMKNLAVAYGQQGKHELELAILNNAKALAEQDPEIRVYMAEAHMGLDEELKARLALEEAVKLPGGGTAEAHNRLGLLYHQAGDYPGAERQFRLALSKWPDMLPAQVNLGNALKGQQKYAEADQALQVALRLAPTNPDVLYDLGILYLDGQIPNVEPIERLQRALGYFDQYKRNRATARPEDPVEQYVAEANKRVEVEKKRAEQMRRRPKPAPDEGADGAPEGAEGAPEGAEGAPEGAAEAPEPAGDAPAEAAEPPAEAAPVAPVEPIAPDEDAPGGEK